MPYKVFAIGAEALAADVNNMLMEQTVARFTNAGQRTTDLVAPEVNQLSMLDSRPGVIDVWNGTAWVPLPQVQEQSFALDPFITVGAGGGSNGYDQTVTLPLTGPLYLDGVAKVTATAGGGGVNTAQVQIQAGAGSVAPTSAIASLYSAYQFASAVMPVKAYWASVPAGSFKIKWVLTTNPATGMTIALRDIYGSLRQTQA